MTATASDRATAVIALGHEPRPHPRSGAVTCFTEAPDAEHTAGLMDVIEAAAKRGDSTLVVYPRWFTDDARRSLEEARAMLTRPPVAVHETALPPLATCALTALAAELEPRLGSAGALAAALPLVEAELHVFAWLATVRRLREPDPGILLRGASALPGVGFAVSSWPEPAVHRVTARDPAVPAPHAAEGALLLVAGGEEGRDWIRSTLVSLLGGIEVQEVEPPAHAAEWWGTSRVTEAVVVPRNLNDVAASLINAVPVGPCRWCGQEVGPSRCPFCGIADPRAALPDGAQPS